MPFGAMLERPPPAAIVPLRACTVTRKLLAVVATKEKYANAVVTDPAGFTRRYCRRKPSGGTLNAVTVTLFGVLVGVAAGDGVAEDVGDKV